MSRGSERTDLSERGVGVRKKFHCLLRFASFVSNQRPN